MYSFADTGWSEVSFEVNEHAPKTTEFAEINGVRISKIAGLFGPNASGKTNVINVYNFIRNFIVFSFHDIEPKTPSLGNTLHYNVLDHTLHYDAIEHMNNHKGSSCEVAFFVNDILYTYSFTIQNCVISKEKLQKKIHGKNSIVIFQREYQKLNFVNLSDPRCSTVQGMLKPKSSVVSTFANLTNIPDNKINKDMKNILEYWGTALISKAYPRNDLASISTLSKQYRELKLEQKLKEFWKETDIGQHEVNFQYLDVFEVRGISSVKTRYLLPVFERKKNNSRNSIKIPLPQESTGFIETFLKLLFAFIVTSGTRPVVAVDELELGLHTEAVSKLLSLFLSSDNVRGQILFTTHMTPLLMNMNKYQVHLVEKNENNESEIFRLDQVEDVIVRADDNIFKKYISGVYGGFPDIDY